MGRSVLVAALVSLSLPAGAASPSPLHEFSDARGLDGVCAVAVVHANAAIAATLHDDDALTAALGILRSIDLDRGAPGRRTAVGELTRLTGDVADREARGASEVKRLHALADGAQDQHEATGLRAFATALDAALERQRRMGLDLEALLHFVTVADIRDGANGADSDPASATLSGDASRVDAGRSRTIGTAPEGPYQAPGRTETGMARAAAADFQTRLADVAGIEARAQDRAAEAVTGC